MFPVPHVLVIIVLVVIAGVVFVGGALLAVLLY